MGSLVVALRLGYLVPGLARVCTWSVSSLGQGLALPVVIPQAVACLGTDAWGSEASVSSCKPGPWCGSSLPLDSPSAVPTSAWLCLSGAMGGS